MTGRVLPVAEWTTKLAGTPLEPMAATLNPDYSVVIVVEDLDGKVVAQCAAINVVHVEALWESEEVRGDVGVSRALLEALVGELTAHGVKEIISQAVEPAAEAMLEAAGGTRLPGSTWVIRVS